jgi:hypothetical protein
MIQEEGRSVVSELPRGLQTLDFKPFKSEFRIEKIMRTIMAEADGCLRTVPALERIMIRGSSIRVPKFIMSFERARCNRYFGLLEARSNATELYLEVLRD